MSRHCSSCGDVLSPKRLQANPSAINCVACQEKIETNTLVPDDPVACYQHRVRAMLRMEDERQIRRLKARGLLSSSGLSSVIAGSDKDIGTGLYSGIY